MTRDALTDRPVRVLVIDDEPLNGKVVRRILGPSHDVVVETRAAAALDRLARGEPFSVIICDLMMPEMTGMDFYEALRASQPQLLPSLVFLTGGAFTDQSRAFLAAVPNRALFKPFDAQELKLLVQDARASAGV